MKTLISTCAAAALLVLMNSCTKTPMPEPTPGTATTIHSARTRDTNRADVYFPRDTMAPQPVAAF